MKSIIGIGNALVDILVRIENDKTLEKLGIPRGSMQLVELATLRSLENGTDNFKKQLRSGGSAANTMNGLGYMGVKSGYIGKVGKDNYASIFRNDLVLNSVNPILPIGTTETGRALTFISPDGERTFATYLGSAAEVSDADITKELLSNYNILYLEGYLVFNKPLVDRAVRLAKELNMEIALDLASFNVVAANKDYLNGLAKDYIDILFANEEESKAFTGQTPEESVHTIAELCKVAVVKLGAEGSLVKTNGQLTSIKPVKANCIDTTGAGDLFAAGFLYGYAKGLSMEDCGYNASIVGAKVVETIGAKIPLDVWKEIKKQLK